MRSQSHGMPYSAGLLTFAALLTFSFQASAQSPAYATVMLFNLSFFEQYTWQVAVLVALLALQLILIVFLLVERVKRRTATRELMSNEKRYRQMFEQNRTSELLIDRESGPGQGQRIEPHHRLTPASFVGREVLMAKRSLCK